MQGVGCRVYDVRCRVSGAGCRVQGVWVGNSVGISNVEGNSDVW